MHDAAFEAMAKACIAVARPGLASMVLDYKLTPQTIISLMRYSLHERAAEHCAIILLAGAIVENDANPEAWSGSAMQAAVRELVDDDAERFERPEGSCRGFRLKTCCPERPAARAQLSPKLSDARFFSTTSKIFNALSERGVMYPLKVSFFSGG